MRDPKRIDEICEALKVAWHQYPDQRLGQLMENYIFPSYFLNDRSSVAMPFWQEDDVTLEKLRKLYDCSQQSSA